MAFDLEVGERVPRTEETLKEDLVAGEVTLEFVWSVDVSERVCLLPRRNEISCFHELLNESPSSLPMLLV